MESYRPRHWKTVTTISAHVVDIVKYVRRTRFAAARTASVDTTDSCRCSGVSLGPFGAVDTIGMPTFVSTTVAHYCRGSCVTVWAPNFDIDEFGQNFEGPELSRKLKYEAIIL